MNKEKEFLEEMCKGCQYKAVLGGCFLDCPVLLMKRKLGYEE